MRKTLAIVFLLISLALSAVSPAAAKQLTVLISIDGFRPGYLSRGNSTILDAQAGSGVVAPGLPAVFPSVTFPNHYSIVTGLFPDHHGIVNNTMFDPPLLGRPFSLATRDALANPARWSEGIPIWVTLHRTADDPLPCFGRAARFPSMISSPDDWLPYNDAMMTLERVEKLLSWLDRPEDQRADFATLYFSEVDSFGHRFGPSAAEVGGAVKRVDAALKHFLAALSAWNFAARRLLSWSQITARPRSTMLTASN